MRIRTIKPEFFTHEGLFDAERESKLPLRIAFAGLWCAADREGRFRWEARRLGISILPYDEVDFSRVLDALATRGFLVKYRVKGVDYGAIPSFARHQIVNNRERASDYPEPSMADDSDATITREPRVDHASKAEGKGRERNGTGKETRVENAPEIPAELSSIQGFMERWDEFKEHRRQIKKPLTTLAACKILSSLKERPARAMLALDTAIRRGWQGFEWAWIDKDHPNPNGSRSIQEHLTPHIE